MPESIPEGDLQRIVSSFEMSERASREDADEPSKNEAANAFVVLMRLLGKYGLTIADIPELQRRHEQIEATKAASAAPAQDRNQPNVLELIVHVLKSYVDVQPHEYVGIALWILHTHLYSRFRVTSRLAALSPVRGCGKTKLLMLLEKLAADPQRHGNISAASIYRLIQHGAPVLLLDEGDNLNLRFDRVMRAVLNDGYLTGGTITRTIRGEPKTFSIFAPLAIAAIGTLTLPLLQRCIVISMHRSTRVDLKTIEAFGLPEETASFEALRRHIITWAQSAQLDLSPPMPKILRGRLADNWRILLSIADSFGSDYWSKTARDAAIAFADGYHDEDAAVALHPHDIPPAQYRPHQERGLDRVA
jgi:Protein of unknown function (DUF3631)